MRVIVNDRLTLEGNEKDVLEALKFLRIEKESYMYKSESRGWLVISEMQSDHLRNAMLKIYQQWVDSLHSIKNPMDVVNAVVEGCTDKTFVAMVLELSKRK